eukprot:6456201-Amphidinium_carterae.2
MAQQPDFGVPLVPHPCFGCCSTLPCCSGLVGASFVASAQRVCSNAASRATHRHTARLAPLNVVRITRKLKAWHGGISKIGCLRWQSMTHPILCACEAKSIEVGTPTVVNWKPSSAMSYTDLQLTMRSRTFDQTALAEEAVYKLKLAFLYYLHLLEKQNLQTGMFHAGLENGHRACCTVCVLIIGGCNR